MENNARTLLILVGAVALAACSSNRIKSELAADEIVSSSDGKTEYPAWAYEAPRFIEGGVLFVSGAVDVNSMQSPSRGLDAALMVARSNLSAELKTRLEAQSQYASLGMDIDQQQINQIINAESKMDRLNGSYVAKKWFGKVASVESGSVQSRYRCFVLVGIPLQVFQSQLYAALQGESGAALPAEFRKKVEKSWEQFFSDGVGSPVSQSVSGDGQESVANGPKRLSKLESNAEATR